MRESGIRTEYRKSTKRTRQQAASGTHGRARTRAGGAELPSVAFRAAALTRGRVRYCAAGILARTSGAGAAACRDMRQVSRIENYTGCKALAARMPHSTRSPTAVLLVSSKPSKVLQTAFQHSSTTRHDAIQACTRTSRCSAFPPRLRWLAPPLLADTMRKRDRPYNV